MKKEYETIRENAMKLSQLILDNPNTRVVAWIDSEGINDEYPYWAGNLGKPEKMFVVYSEIEGNWSVAHCKCQHGLVLKKKFQCL